MLMGFILSLYDTAKEKFGTDTQAVIAVGLKMLSVIGAIRLAMLLPVPPWAKALIGIGVFVLGDLLGDILMKYIVTPLGDFFGFADGGTVPRTGSYLVGERGPEIVRMPAGANVVPNHAIGGNTINVNVSGRVGASDREIRDIAQKVGRMVNMEINRNTSSNIRGA